MARAIGSVSFCCCFAGLRIELKALNINFLPMNYALAVYSAFIDKAEKCPRAGLSTMTRICNPSIQDCDFKVSLSYTVNCRLAWDKE